MTVIDGVLIDLGGKGTIVMLWSFEEATTVFKRAAHARAAFFADNHAALASCDVETNRRLLSHSNTSLQR
jgi:hypothetical protein